MTPICLIYYGGDIVQADLRSRLIKFLRIYDLDPIVRIPVDRTQEIQAFIAGRLKNLPIVLVGNTVDLAIVVALVGSASTVHHLYYQSGSERNFTLDRLARVALDIKEPVETGSA